MHVFTCGTIHTLFKFSCLGTTIFMVAYWFYIFGIKDESLCLVDYKKVEETEENELPVVSFCFRSPFLDEKLREINPNISSDLYERYLRGGVFDERLSKIMYDNVTFNLENYLGKSETTWRDGRR